MVIDSNEVILFLAECAAQRFGSEKDGIFNSACFSSVLQDVFRLENPIDGLFVKLILGGRLCIEYQGSGHWRVRR